MHLKKYDKIISIVIVSLNTDKDFKKTLDSIIRQNIKKKYIEVIVVDGGSTDKTPEVIKKYIKFIDSYIIKKDRGIYDAMNKGVKLSRGKWIIFMNSGDIFYGKDILKKIFNFCINYNDVDIIFGNTLMDNKNLSFRLNGNYFKKSTCLMPFCHQSSIVKKKLLRQKPFDLNFHLSSDFNFFINCYLNHIKFQKFNYIISKVKAGGQSDVFRQRVLSENIKIFWVQKKIALISLLGFLKIFIFIKDFIKSFLTPQLVTYLMKIKYNKK